MIEDSEQCETTDPLPVESNFVAATRDSIPQSTTTNTGRMRGRVMSSGEGVGQALGESEAG